MRIKSLLSLAVLATAVSAQAVGPFAQEDFDGNTGQTGPTSAVYTPDNSMSMFNGNLQPGNFPSSGFDVFGVYGRDLGSFLPFDIADSSAGSFPADQMGIYSDNKNDAVLALGDTVNNDNAGPVSAVWTFDITGRTNLELSLDIAATGDFDSDDDFIFSYSIDGGSSSNVFDIQIDETVDPMFGLTDSGILYGVTMEAGGFYDNYFAAFFESDDWDDVVAGTAGSGFDYHPDDDDQDGFITRTFLSGPQQVRAYLDGSFEEEEIEAYRDPLFANPTTAPDANGNNFSTGTQITNQFQTLTAPISGTGTTLTLRLDGLANGSQEYVIFDNLVLSEADASLNAGDFNADGKVDNDDLNLLLANWGNNSVPAAWTNGFAGTVDNDELNALLAGWGTGVSVAIPEPTAAALVLLGMAGFAARRR